MKERPNCLKRTTCVAKRPDRHCHRCMMVARNKSPEQREAVRISAKADTAKTEKMRLTSLTKAVRQKAVAARLDREFAWCPPAFRHMYRVLTRHGSSDVRYTREEAKRIILEHVERVAERVKANGEREMADAELRRLRESTGLPEEAFNRLVASLRADNVIG